MKAPNKANIDTMLSKTKGYVDSEISKVNNELDDKQDTLTAGTNITIDANNVISASGGLTEVTANDVNSEQATSGQVLTADGNGGANWQNASGGKLYLHRVTLNIGNYFSNIKLFLLLNTETTLTNTTLPKFLKNHLMSTEQNRLIIKTDIVKQNNLTYHNVGIYSLNGIARGAYFQTLQLTTDGSTITETLSSINGTFNVSEDYVVEL